MRHRVGIRDLRDHLSRWLERVRGGDEVVVTDHGRVVAVLGAPPGRARARTWEEHVARGRALGRFVGGAGRLPPRAPIDAPGARLEEAVLEDREEPR